MWHDRLKNPRLRETLVHSGLKTLLLVPHKEHHRGEVIECKWEALEGSCSDADDSF